MCRQWPDVAAGKSRGPGIGKAALLLVLLLTMLNTYGVIVGVITAAGGQKTLR